MPRRTGRSGKKIVPCAPAPDPYYVYDSDDDDYRPDHHHNDSESDGDNSSDNGSEIKPTLFKTGMKGEIKKLYENRKKCRRCPKWVDEIPDDTVDSMIASKEVQQYAVVARYKRHSSDKGELKIDSITIQSPRLRPLLEEVFKGFPGFTALERLEFSAPFVPFFHRWQQFKLARWGAIGETRVHADLLYEALHAQIEDDMKTSSEHVAKGVISYDLIWTLFVPGEFIACKAGGHNFMCTVSRAVYYKEEKSGRQKGYIVSCRYIDSGRFGLGLAVLVLTLPEFSGTMPISELPFEDLREETKDYPIVLAMPAKLRPDVTALRTQLIERGRKFESLQGCHYRQYDGDMDEKIDGRRRIDSVKRKVSTKIIIDVESYESNAHTVKAALLPLDADLTPQGEEMPETFPEIQVHINDPYCGDGRNMQQRIEDRLRNFSVKSTSKLTDEQLLLCSPRVKGYNLKSKCWGEFAVDNVRDIKFDNDAFSNVVIPANYKSLISSFVIRHMSQNDNFDDIVAGKGRGLIILLSGDPGVGKTLTAETVAEELRAPLYSFGAGELGSFADDVERKLSEVLELCNRWKAVLLLDEADVFLQKRNSYDMERNKIISVFLRVLEYYEGMMFMTTNRVSTIDEAFRSRIHVNMNYPPLDKAARTSIWTNFLLNKATNVAITKEQIEGLADKNLNGREIKNMVKIAGLLAGQQGKTMDIGHLHTIMDINTYDTTVDQGDEGDEGFVLED